MIRAALLLLFLQAPPQPTADLGRLAESARRAFQQREFNALFDAREPVRLELPNQPASVSVAGRVAAAALSGLVRRTEDVSIDGVGAAVVAEGHGYVELRRVFRAVGTQEPHTQRILVSARLAEGRWRVTEIWVSPADAPTP
ncbi:MAG: hypothetical protein SFV24_07730 [Gemmatimonadales bacterium]|nr:hypothetical protein [Gemmatimonadales bacterium]MDX2057678.1 hypothetical protein [Gemmatimonadales bacterium]